MAVYRWIYANAKMEGNRKDYHVRVCDPELRKYEQTLLFLSNRLLSTEKRYDDAGRQNCWFSGYVDEKLYVIALGGDQKELLGISTDGYRNQHCVLGYGLTEKDIQLLQKDEALFEPLKEIMREIQHTGKDWEADGPCVTGLDRFAYVDSGEAVSNGDAGREENYNIIMSTEETDRALWKLSLRRPVMTGIISVEDAKRLLRLFPAGIVTVMEDVKMRYYEKKEKHMGSRPEEKAGINSGAENGKGKKVFVTEAGVVWDNSSSLEPSVLRGRENQENPGGGGGEKNNKRGKVKGWLSKIEMQKEERQREENIRGIMSCAEWCKDRLPSKQRKCIEKAIKQLRMESELRTEDGFLEQIEYYGYMFFYQKCYNGEKRTDERYTYYVLKIWAEKMKNEEEALENNLALYKTISELKKRMTGCR